MLAPTAGALARSVESAPNAALMSSHNGTIDRTCRGGRMLQHSVTLEAVYSQGQ